MTNKQPQIVSIDGIEYEIEKLSNGVKLLINHIADLDRKITNIDFQRQQLQVGRDAFFNMLNIELSKENSNVEK